MIRRRLAVLILLVTSPLHAEQLELVWAATQTQIQQGSPSSEMSYFSSRGNIAAANSFKLSSNLRLWWTAWVQLDSLPSDNPLQLPEGKVRLTSRLLEGGVTWEPLPGTLVIDVGKKVVHSSSGFFRTPLNVLARSSVVTGGQALDPWEEGWVGATVTWFAGPLTLSEAWLPSITWAEEGWPFLPFLTSPQSRDQHLTKLAYHWGDTDLSLVNLASYRADAADRDLHDTVGLGLDSLLTENLTLRFEASAVDRQTRWKTDGTSVAPDTVSWPINAMLGSTWTIRQDLTLMGEWGFHGLGFQGTDYARLMDLAATSRAGLGLLSQDGALSAAQHYGFLRLADTIETGFEANLWGQVNLQDGSGIGGVGLNWTHDRWSLVTEASQVWGRSHTEGAFSPLLGRISAEWHVFF